MYNIRMKVEKESKMTLDEVNSELQLVAQELVDEVVDIQYNEMMEEMFELFELEQYARDCADLDAEYYGGRVW